MDEEHFSESSSDPESETVIDDDDDDEEELQLKKSINKPRKRPVQNRSQQSNKAKRENEATNGTTVVRKRAPGRSSILTGRGVTTQMLIEEKILEAGEKCLTIDYLGRKFIGDLNIDGTIKCNNVNKVFSSPSSWAMNCKKQINPDKKSGCGWASVRYRGRKLDEFKSSWFRKQKLTQVAQAKQEKEKLMRESITVQVPGTPSIETSSASPMKGRLPEILPSSFSNPLGGNAISPPPNSNQKAFTFSPPPMKSSPSIFHSPHHKVIRKRNTRSKASIKYSAIQPNSDPTTLVECSMFHTTGRIQPFSVAISTNTLLLIDLHSHLLLSEVSGYLVGKWDPERQHIRISQACPCRYPQNATQQQMDQVENQIREYVCDNELMLLGWYHSHVYCQPDPTILDIGYQLQHQQMLRDGDYEPCVGLIVSSYESYKKESQFNAFWVRSPVENQNIGLPLSVRFTTYQDQYLTQDLVNEMVALVNFYRLFPDCVKSNEIWMDNVTYLTKLKQSVLRKCPSDQTDGRFLDFIHKMLMACYS